MIWISTEDVIAIHSRVIQITGGMEGIRDYASLEAAIAAPLQSFGGQDLFLEDIDKIARIDMALLQIMPSSTEISALEQWWCSCCSSGNGYTILLQDGELADTFIAIADGTMKEKELSDWIRIHLQ